MNKPEPLQRKIVHVDMDAFYASVEVLDRPELKGKPLVVGGSPETRAVVCSASYEARRFGVRSAMPCSMAKRICPQAIFLSPRFERYREISQNIHKIFHEVTSLVEPLSLDEAFLDVTENKLGMLLARDVARWIKDQIRSRVGLTASAGAAPNKFLAKIASDHKKPDGLFVIPPEKVDEFLLELPVSRLWGVGPVTEKKLKDRGLERVGQIREFGETRMEREFGSFGGFLYGLSCGVDSRRVEADWDPKSRGAETTFNQDVLSLSELEENLGTLSEEVAESLQKMERLARTVTLKVRYRDFTTVTRSRSLSAPTQDPSVIFQTALESLHSKTEVGRVPVRLIGVTVSGFQKTDEPYQLSFSRSFDFKYTLLENNYSKRGGPWI